MMKQSWHNDFLPIMACLMWPVQAGMREQASGEVTIHDASEEVVQVLIAFMYGHLSELQDSLLLPLFIVADAYQASLLPIVHTLTELID